MDYLKDLTSYVHKHSILARRAYLVGHPLEALEQLEKVWDILCKQFAGNAPRLSKKTKSAK